MRELLLRSYKNMTENTWTFLSALLAAAVFAGCSDDGMNLGNKWVDVNSHIIFIDTCSVEVSSVRLDSIVTSGGNTVFAGIRESDWWGRTELSTCMMFKATEDFSASDTPEYSQRIIFDSLTLSLAPDDSFCGDTLVPMTLTAYRLAEELALNDDGELYAHTDFETEPEEIAKKTFIPHPVRDTVVEIRLSDELGRELLEKVTDSDTEVETDENFRSWFKGLMLKAEDPTRSILGFEASDSLCMLKLYYSTQDYAEPEEHVLEFKVDTTYLFTRVAADLSGTPLEAFADKDIKEIESEDCDHLAFASGMLGIYTKIGFPYLNNLRSIADHCSAANAQLVIYPKAGTYCKPNYSGLPPTLNLYVSDENNISTGGAIISSDGQSLQSGSLTYDEMMFPENTCYTYDVTDFINGQFGKIGINKNFLQMIDPDYGYTINELVLGDRFSEGYNIKLVIELATYNE